MHIYADKSGTEVSSDYRIMTPAVPPPPLPSLRGDFISVHVHAASVSIQLSLTCSWTAAPAWGHSGPQGHE